MSNEYVDIISMNLNDNTLKQNDGGFQTLEPGTYDFEIEKTATGQSQSGNATLKVTAKVVGPEDSASKGRTMTNTYVINDTDFARGRMLAFITATQIELDANGAFSREALVGAQFTADVEKQTGKTFDKMGQEVDRDFTKWLRERPVGGSAPIQVTSAPPAKTAAPAATGSAPRRPAAPNGSGNGAAKRA